MSVEPDPVNGLPVAEADDAWSVERGILWLAEHRALMRVLRTDEGAQQVFVSVRPRSHPDDVLVVRRPCPQDAPLLVIAAAIEEAAAALLADEARTTLRLVAGGVGGRVPSLPVEGAGPHVQWDSLDTPTQLPGGRR